MTEDELLALPVSVDIQTAGRVLGLSKNTAYRRARENAFPFPVMRVGGRYVVPRAGILKALGVTDPGLSLALTAVPKTATPLATASDH